MPQGPQPFDPRQLDHAQLASALIAAKPILIDKLTAACGIDSAEAGDILAEVLRFLSLARFAPGWLTPSQRVDQAWHEFILCTRLYDAYCREHVGHYIHHDPGGDDAVNRDQFAETIRLYQVFFGPPPPAYWGQRPEHAPVADCGPCQTSAQSAQASGDRHVL